MTDVSINTALNACSAALEAGDLERAWTHLMPLRERIDTDRALALGWLALLHHTPRRPQLLVEAERIGKRWPHDPEVVTRACDALIGAAELRAPDEPPTQAEGPAYVAAELAKQCLANWQPKGKPDALMSGYLHVGLGNALRLCGPEHGAMAKGALEHALAFDPNRGAWWMNLGLLHKTAGDWDEALKAFQQACLLLGNQKPVLWNVVIAATALGQGNVAAEALKVLGIDASVNESGMPFVDGVPACQLRVATRGTGRGVGQPVPDQAVSFEVVWASPLSPVHGVVQTPTSREASVDYGDLVLWDVAPVGVDRDGDRPVPRFPILALLKRGRERRYPFVALQKQSGEVEKLQSELSDDAIVFVHNERVTTVCAHCALQGLEGEEPKHTGNHERPSELVYGKLVIPETVDLHAFRHKFDALIASHSDVKLVVPGLLEAVGDSPAAGKAHQAWRGIERAASRKQNLS